MVPPGPTEGQVVVLEQGAAGKHLGADRFPIADDEEATAFVSHPHREEGGKGHLIVKHGESLLRGEPHGVSPFCYFYRDAERDDRLPPKEGEKRAVPPSGGGRLLVSLDVHTIRAFVPKHDPHVNLLHITLKPYLSISHCGKRKGSF